MIDNDKKEESNKIDLEQIELLKKINDKFEEQEKEIQKIREYQKTQELNYQKHINNMNNKKDVDKTIEFEFRNDDEDDIEQSKIKAIRLNHNKIWEKQFGEKTHAIDFAGQPIFKSKFNLDEEGGWNIDFYDENDLTEYYITSQESMYERAGRKEFEIEGKLFKIKKTNNKYKIINSNEIKEKYKEKILIDDEILEKNLENFLPEQVKKYNGEYESYSSLLINFNHYPIDYLEQLEGFLNNVVNDLSISIKNVFFYLNREAYRERRTDITSYARIYFKYKSIKEEIDIVFATLSIKKAIEKFIHAYRTKNNRYVISSSMILMNHNTDIKYIQAQTNFDILKERPVPSKLPINKLVIDREYNSILKFHENEMWKKIKPFALDHTGNTYYVLNIDPDDYI